MVGGDVASSSALTADGLICVAATRRLQRHMLERFAQDKREQAWPTPEVLVWGDWLGNIWRQIRITRDAPDPSIPLLLQPAQESVLWEQQIHRLAQDDLLNLHATSRSAANSWQLLHDHNLDMEQWRHTDQDVDMWRRWARGFIAKCRQRGWITYAELPGRLCQALDTGRWRPPEMVRFIGFINPTPAQRMLWRTLERCGCKIEQYTEACARTVVTQVPCQDPLDELVKAARWARSLLQDGETGPIGVVVRDLASVRDEVMAIFRGVLDPVSGTEMITGRAASFHISLGRPLADHPVIADALCLLRWYQQALPIATMARILRSPFIHGGDAERVARADVDNQLRVRGWHEVSVFALRDWLQRQQQCDQLLQCLHRAAELKPAVSRLAPGEWAKHFTAWLNCFAWPGPRELDSAEYQTVVTWREMLSRFAATSLVTSSLDAVAAIGQVARMARQQIYQPLLEPAPVQVMGLAEAQGLRFSHLWLAGMSEDEWPPPPRPDPFLPVGVQRRAGLPDATAETTLQLAGVITKDLRGAAGSVYVSFPRQKLEQRLDISPLFADTNVSEPVLSEFLGATRYLSLQRTPLQPLHEAYGPPVAADETLRGGAGLFQDQALCPFRAFARRRLHAYGAPLLDPGISPALHGNLVHAALSRLWERWRTQAMLNELTATDRETAITQVVDELMDERVFSHSPFSDALWLVQRQRLIELLIEWLEVEQARPGFSVLATEQIVDAEYGGVPVRLQLDRIDETDSGCLVLDFKTGNKISANRWFDERPEQPQLPLYALAATQKVQGIAFAWVRRGACEIAGFSGDEMAIPGVRPLADDPGAWRAQLHAWRTAMESLGAEIRNGHAEVAPKSAAACQTCDLHGLCRIYELVGTEHDENDR